LYYRTSRDVPPDTKQVISETFFPANRLAMY